MFASSTPSSIIDSIYAAEGNFKIPSRERLPQIEILMVYSNQKSGATCGSCPTKENRFSEATLDLFWKFIESAEKDFGELVLEDGFNVAPGQTSALGIAESPDGIQTKSLGGG